MRCQGGVEEQEILHSSRYPVDGLHLLRISTAAQVTRHVFATAILGAGSGSRNSAAFACDRTDDRCTISAKQGDGFSVSFDPFGGNGVGASGG